MVKESGRFNSLYKKYIETRMKGRKRFDLEDLENFLIEKSGGVSAYQAAGGYQALYLFLREKEKAGEITAIKSAVYNGRQPALKTRWQLQLKTKPGWSDELIFSLSRRLDIKYYLKRPQLQTEELARRLFKLSSFLSGKEDREWASREERSLELFKDEKFLAGPEGRKLLSRLNLTLADLKAEKYSQMFVYWNKRTPIQRVLILENHSAFIACKRALEKGYDILNYRADTLVYGEGKHIIDSFKFLEELAGPDGKLSGPRRRSADLREEIDLCKKGRGFHPEQGGLEIKYAGDIDPEGWFIYSSLKEKYPDYRLELFLKYYEEMLLQSPENAYPIVSEQQKSEIVIERILNEIIMRGNAKLADKVAQLWNADSRLPQELITYEVLMRD